MRKTLKFENRAWEMAEHPRYVSDVLKLDKDREVVFEVSYHYVERKYYVEVSETKTRRNGFRETYASWRFFDSLEECFDYIERTYKVKVVRHL